MKKILLLVIITATYITTFSQSSVVGTTTYDVQTNNGSKNRIIAYDDGKISALWTGSTDFGGTWPERGMFYNHYDGATWATAPTERVEGLRTGFGEILQVEDHELVISHSIVGSDTLIILYENDAIGSTSWTETGGSGQIEGLWPLTYCPGGTDDIYIVNATSFSFGLPQALSFSRSDDGGETWAVMGSILPYITAADGFPSIAGAADSYLVRVHGSDVYVLFGITTSDLILLHSNDYGNDGTWESTDIIDFPFDNYTGSVQTDIDADGITDTIGTSDGYLEMLITDDGTVHVFTGYLRCYSDGFGNIFNFNSSGIWHWSTGMDAAVVIDTELDWVSDDCIYAPYTGIGYDDYIYRFPGLSTNPAASWDASSGRLYCLFTMALEYTDIYGDPLNFAAESFRDIFGMYSDDDGATWTVPNNLTNTAETGEENFFLFAADRVIDGKVNALWQQDDAPGTALEGDVLHENNILHQSFEESDFVAPLATPAFDYEVDLYYVTFTDMSTDATCYSWDFGDGGTSTLASPAHTYAGGGTYTVCLTVSNSYGPVTYCQDVNLVTAPATDFSFTGDPEVTFTDLSANTPTSWSWDFADGFTSTDQNPVHTFDENGSYNVCLTATNAGGSNTNCHLVGINFATIAPEADYTFSIVGLTASFTDLSTNTPTSWSWNFDDGSAPSTEQNPSHTYAAPGEYNVCLQSGNGGGIDIACKLLQVGVAINDISNFINIFPNPAKDFIFIDANKDISSATIELYNALGQKMNVEVIMNSGNKIQIDVKNIAAGNYNLKITTDDFEGRKGIVIE